MNSTKVARSSPEETLSLVRRVAPVKSAWVHGREVGHFLWRSNKRCWAELRGNTLLLHVVGEQSSRADPEQLARRTAAENIMMVSLKDATVSTDTKFNKIRIKRPKAGERTIELKLKTSSETKKWHMALLRCATQRAPTLHDFELITQVGKGASGRVFLVRDRLNGERLALKVIEKTSVYENDDAYRHALDERLVLEMACDHPFILNLRYAFQTDSRLYLVTEYCDGGDLFDYLKKKGKPFREAEGRRIAGEILLALEHIHSLGVVYRDLKLENVLLDLDGHVRIADFGLSKLLGKRRHAAVRSSHAAQQHQQQQQSQQEKHQYSTTTSQPHPSNAYAPYQHDAPHAPSHTHDHDDNSHLQHNPHDRPEPHALAPSPLTQNNNPNNTSHDNPNSNKNSRHHQHNSKVTHSEAALKPGAGPGPGLPPSPSSSSVVHKPVNLTKTFCGTREYVAPEMLSGNEYGQSVDLWAFGILLYEILCGRTPFYSRNRDEVYSKIEHGPLRFPRNLSQDVISLIRGLLDRNPNTRLGLGPEGINAIKRHAFFRGMDWDGLAHKVYHPDNIKVEKNLVEERVVAAAAAAAAAAANGGSGSGSGKHHSSNSSGKSTPKGTATDQQYGGKTHSPPGSAITDEALVLGKDADCLLEDEEDDKKKRPDIFAMFVATKKKATNIPGYSYMARPPTVSMDGVSGREDLPN